MLGEELSEQGYHASYVYCDAQMMEITKAQMELLEGRVPEKANEVVVSEYFLSTYGNNAKIGDTVTLDTESFHGDYVVTGIMDSVNEKEALINHIDDEFETIVNAILACNGRVIVTGMGKSGHVGRKIAASLASTGTPSFFMHPAEAFHGDLGMVTANDMVLAISNSGESNEIVNILPIIKRIGAKIIAMSGRRESTLGKNADYYIDISVEREACPLGLAPTASTTATLAMGDALAIALLSSRNFTAQDFAVFHPGGALGRRLLLTVENVMHSGEDNPVISVHKTAKEALFLMTAKGLGATSVVDENGKFIGLVTDGDIRRMLARGAEFLDEPVEDLMTKNPVIITKDKMAAEALSMMEKHQPKPITVLPVIDVEKNEPVGIVHLTDLLRQGVV